MPPATIGLTLQVLAVASSALVLAAAVLPAAPRWRPVAPVAERVGRWAVIATGALVFAAVVLVEIALVTRDERLGFVTVVTEDALPTFYRITALWSAMDGSLLLWSLVVAIVSAVFVARVPAGVGRSAGAALPIHTAALGATLLSFTTISLVESPFAADAAEQAKPSPLLQDHPAMGVHPPLLYAGFACMLVPYILSLVALARGHLDEVWRRSTHRWTLVGWVLLTVGIGLGAWWSYAVLGWGGYWAWDPVENASLLPWLAATVVLHSVGPRTRGPSWRRWAAITAGLPFVLVLIATFLTRSGVVASIHAFALSPVGGLLGVVAALGTGAWLILAILRGRRLDPPAPSAASSGAPWTALRAGRIALLLVLAVVLVGTVAPTIVAATTGATVSIGPPWYGRTLAPLAVAVLVLMAVTPLLLDRRGLSPSTVAATAAGAAAALVCGIVVRDVGTVVTTALAVFVTVTGGRRLTARALRPTTVGSVVAHIGIALSAVAIVAGGQSTVAERTLAIGEAARFGDVDAVLVSVERVDDGRTLTARARLVVSTDTGSSEAAPELRYYPDHAAVLAGPSIDSRLGGDVYVSLLDVDPDTDSATVRIASIPLVPWLWGTGSLVALGGAICLLPARRGRTAARSGVEEARNEPVRAS
ncbi:hypothetical protein ELQ92_01675 [Labedella populi]|uniref:Heme lyase CcmF/NrfE family subunit n=1 Tax=Labedella populi TaxID=2498850 RepID=A0A3S4E7D1_9MICO|nr:cytochrome c-type biogenesis CcmF C-terminal domain-containing protein [Labedella populi]RWZ67993.1 hypothetical protein ELQ92_01675 [Labedella populi]